MTVARVRMEGCKEAIAARFTLRKIKGTRRKGRFWQGKEKKTENKAKKGNGNGVAVTKKEAAAG